METTNRNYTSARIIYLTPQGPQSVDIEGSKDLIRNSKKIADNAFRDMARLGYEGWELVSTTSEANYGIYTFKRQLD